MAFLIIRSTPSAASVTEYVGQDSIQKPYCDPVLNAGQDPQDCFYQASKRSNLAENTGFNSCSCVSYAKFKSKLGIRTLDGFARSIPINSTVPADSGLVITFESLYGHVALYRRVGAILILDESNYSHCKVTTGRELPVGSALIKGYIN